VIRYGYKDKTGNDDNDFENQLIHNLAEFIQTEASAPWIPSSSEMSLDGRMTVMGTLQLVGSFASNTSLSLSSLSEPTSERATTTTDNPTVNEYSFEVSPARPPPPRIVLILVIVYIIPLSM